VKPLRSRDARTYRCRPSYATRWTANSYARTGIASRDGVGRKKNLPTDRRGHFVEENGKRYDPKWVLKFATGEGLSKFRLVQAEKTLRALGFNVDELDDLGGDNDAEAHELEEAIEAKFGIERDMQTALRSHIEQLEQGLKIIDGGKETVVESGRIDITAEDRGGSTVVIELKAGEAGRDAIGQILAYMGDLTGGKKSIRGILVAGDFSLKAVAAARIVPVLQLRKYSFKFSFEAVGVA
jgi:hypothetical protein